MRNFISTPNLSLKRKLKERFKVYNIDEFRTSCLSYETKDLCKNLEKIFYEADCIKFEFFLYHLNLKYKY